MSTPRPPQKRSTNAPPEQCPERLQKMLKHAHTNLAHAENQLADAKAAWTFACAHVNTELGLDPTRGERVTSEGLVIRKG